MRDPVGFRAGVLPDVILRVAPFMCEQLFLRMTAPSPMPIDADRACLSLLQVICADGHTCESGSLFSASCRGHICCLCEHPCLPVPEIVWWRVNSAGSC